jgi:hypothetical protein
VTLVSHTGTSTPSWSLDTATPGLLRISNLSPVGRSQSVTFTFSLAVTSGCANYQILWNADAWSGSSFSGDRFDPLTLNLATTAGCDTNLDCDTNYVEVGLVNFTKTTLDRLFDKNGPTCTPIPISVLFADDDRTVQVAWDEAANSNVVILSTTEWPVEPLPSTSWPKRTRVAWLTDGSGPVFIDAPACVSNSAPTLVGTVLTTMPYLGSTLPAGYAGEQSRICIVEETVQVQEQSTDCPMALNGCVKVTSKMYIVGDPWLSRN